jgi:hypothetical protein
MGGGNKQRRPPGRGLRSGTSGSPRCFCIGRTIKSAAVPGRVRVADTKMDYGKRADV